MNIFCSLRILALKAELLLIFKNDKRAGKRIDSLFGIPLIESNSIIQYAIRNKRWFIISIPFCDVSISI